LLNTIKCNKPSIIGGCMLHSEIYFKDNLYTIYNIYVLITKY